MNVSPDWLIYYSAHVVAILGFAYCLLRPPFPDWLLVYFSTAFIASFIAVLLVNMGAFTFPHSIFTNYISEQFFVRIIGDATSCRVVSSNNNRSID